MLYLRDLVRVTGQHASVTDSPIRIIGTCEYRSGSVIRLLELEVITSRTVISCCPKGLHELDGTYNFQKADVIGVDVVIIEDNGTRAIVILMV
jgi:hypothetical protein